MVSTDNDTQAGTVSVPDSSPILPGPPCTTATKCFESPHQVELASLRYGISNDEQQRWTKFVGHLTAIGSRAFAAGDLQTSLPSRKR